MLLKPSSVSTSTLRGLTELNGSTDKEKSRVSHALSSVNCAIGSRENKCYAKLAKKKQVAFISARI